METIERLKTILENLRSSYRKQGKKGESVLCDHLLDFIERNQENGKKDNKTFQRHE